MPTLRSKLVRSGTMMARESLGLPPTLRAYSSKAMQARPISKLRNEVGSLQASPAVHEAIWRYLTRTGRLNPDDFLKIQSWDALADALDAEDDR